MREVAPERRVVVVGAGAAGLSAARTLVAAGIDVTVFEARDRIGGRAHTDYGFASYPVELGAEFIHGESVATWDWVRELGARTTGDAHAYETWFEHQGALLDPPSYDEAVGFEASRVLEQLAGAWVAADRDDAAASALLDGWEERFGAPLAEDARRMLANRVAQGASADIEQLGIYRRREATYAGDGSLRHWRLLEGYGALMSGAAEGLDIRLECPVTRIRWDEAGVEVTAKGAASRFDRAILAVPLGVLRAGTIDFEPPLPDAKRQAIQGLVPGHINKVILRFDEAHWPPDLTFLFTSRPTQLWWRPGQGQAAEEPLITAFFGGSDAKAWEDLTAPEAIAEATSQLGDILGVALPPARDGRFIAWGAAEFTRMGYSGVPPHGLGLRHSLGAPLGALHFAGEATEPVRPATVHGAIDSGRRAASEVLRGANQT